MGINIDFPLLDDLVNIAIKEDLSHCGDCTSYPIDDDLQADFVIYAKEEAMICGVNIAVYILKQYMPVLTNLQVYKNDGDIVTYKEKILSATAPAKHVLIFERLILNIMQNLSGVSTFTAKLLKEVSGTNAKILDTRKTLIGMRALQKYAVRVAGGYNHRMGLSDSVLIKDNHIQIWGSITKAVQSVKKTAPFLAKIEVECANLNQVKEACAEAVDCIMLDNMSIDEMKEAVLFVNKTVTLEASGNINLSNIRDVAMVGVDYISVGAITHSVKSIDISLSCDVCL